MGLKDLEGKRIGRPKGSKNAPPWTRAARWALENLDNLEAVPPSPLAGRLAALGRNHPDRLALLLNMLTEQGWKQEGRPAECSRPPTGRLLVLPNSGLVLGIPEQPPPAQVEAQKPARRLTTVLMPPEGTIRGLKRLLRMYCSSYEIEGADDDRKWGSGGILLTISSPDFEPVAEGEPIPHLGRVSD
jgi:hypothetical protein